MLTGTTAPWAGTVSCWRIAVTVAMSVSSGLRQVRRKKRDFGAA